MTSMTSSIETWSSPVYLFGCLHHVSNVFNSTIKMLCLELVHIKRLLSNAGPAVHPEADAEIGSKLNSTAQCSIQYSIITILTGQIAKILKLLGTQRTFISTPPAMAITFERDPWGWVHPFYRRRQLMDEMTDFFQNSAAMTNLNRLNNLLELETVVNQPRIINEGDKFEMKLDVQQFAPKELDVKLVNNYLIVEGKHEEKQDEHGFVSRHFLRKYLLPSDVKPETITCDLSSDGVLQISAPKQLEIKNGAEKLIPIKYTGLPAITDVKRDRTIAAAC